MAVLGVSVYPDLRPLDEIECYLKRASSVGYTRVFSSMFSAPGSPREVLDLFRDLCERAHKCSMQVSLDINPGCMRRLGATPKDLSVFDDIGVDILRMDGAYEQDENVCMLQNPYGMRIEYNASSLAPKEIEALCRRGVDRSRILSCHNFYPQRYTGFRWDRFREVNERLAPLGIPIGAFVSSHADDAHGVWDASCGLPTVERLRDAPVGTQARVMCAAGTTDVFFGNAYATDDELRTVAKALRPYEPHFLNEEHERAVRESEYLDFRRLMDAQKRVCVRMDPDATEIERSILFDFFPHVDMGDSSEWIWRSRMPRVFYQDAEIAPRAIGREFFEVGDVLIVNDTYKHYAAEIQVALKPLRNDGMRNRIGHISDLEMLVFDAVCDGDAVVFVG